MKRRLCLYLLAVICFALPFSGCSQYHPVSQQQQGGLMQQPQRIVSLTLETDEILLSLVAPERIAALTYLADDEGISNVTQAAKQVQGRIKTDAESIIAVKPDLVITSNWQSPEIIKSLKEAGIPVYVYKTPSTIEQIKQVVHELAHLVGEEQKGAEIVSVMERDLNEISSRIKDVPLDQKVTVMRYTLIGATDGKGSLFDDMCQYAGVINGVSQTGAGTYELLSKEKVIAVNPNMLILPTWDANGKIEAQRFKEDIQSDSAFSSMKAVQKQQLILLSDKHVSCASQYIVLGIRDLSHAAYPNVF